MHIPNSLDLCTATLAIALLTSASGTGHASEDATAPVAHPEKMMTLAAAGPGRAEPINYVATSDDGRSLYIASATTLSCSMEGRTAYEWAIPPHRWYDFILDRATGAVFAHCEDRLLRLDSTGNVVADVAGPYWLACPMLSDDGASLVTAEIDRDGDERHGIVRRHSKTLAVIDRWHCRGSVESFLSVEADRVAWIDHSERLWVHDADGTKSLMTDGRLGSGWHAGGRVGDTTFLFAQTDLPRLGVRLLQKRNETWQFLPPLENTSGSKFVIADRTSGFIADRSNVLWRIGTEGLEQATALPSAFRINCGDWNERADILTLGTEQGSILSLNGSTLELDVERTSGPVARIATDASATVVAWAGDDGPVHLSRNANKDRIGFPRLRAPLALSSDGRTLYAAGDETEVVQVNLSDPGTEAGSMRLGKEVVRDMALSRDGQVLAVGYGETRDGGFGGGLDGHGILALWSTANQEMTAQSQLRMPAMSVTPTSSSDEWWVGSYMSVQWASPPSLVGRDPTANWHRLADAGDQATWVTSVSWNPANSILIGVAGGECVTRPASGPLQGFSAEARDVRCATWLSTGVALLGLGSGEVRVIDLDSHQPLSMWRLSSAAITALHVHSTASAPGEWTLFVGTAEGELTLWRPQRD